MLNILLKDSPSYVDIIVFVWNDQHDLVLAENLVEIGVRPFISGIGTEMIEAAAQTKQHKGKSDSKYRCGRSEALWSA